jgi:hypothetical protein
MFCSIANQEVLEAPMKITWVVGNGFDIRYNLKTRYKDFYDHIFSDYIEGNCIYDTIKRDRAIFESTSSTQYGREWADLEKDIGDMSCHLDERNLTINKFTDAIMRLNGDLRDYITEQSQSYQATAEDKKIFGDSLIRFRKSFLPEDSEAFADFIKTISNGQSLNIEYRFITFNYTKVIDSVSQVPGFPKNATIEDTSCAVNIGRIVHVHGDIDTGIILGCNDASQYAFDVYPELAEYLEKSVLNEKMKRQYAKQAQEIINDTDVFILFGISMGETDNLWWNLIARRLLAVENSRLIIFSYQSDYDPRSVFNYQIREQVPKVFISRLNKGDFSDEQIEEIGAKIIVSCEFSSLFRSATSQKKQ